MTGIYNDGFLDYLQENLGDPVKTNPKNIICPCPWCDVGRDTSKPHLWISLEAPIFNCFRAGCGQSGIVRKLLTRISGTDTSDVYVDKDKIQSFAKKRVELKRNIFRPRKMILPVLNERVFAEKTLYTRQRLKFAKTDIHSIKGLIFDIHEFLRINKIQLENKVLRFVDYLHTNFIGFLFEHHTGVIFRNVDRSASFRYYKLGIQNYQLLDYYKLNTGNRNSKDVVLSEGIFDIFTEHIFDVLGLRQKCRLYAAGLSSKFQSLIKSIAFHEQVFNQNVHILSDSEVDIDYYKKLKFFNRHIIKSMTVYYNRAGRDFNDTPVVVQKFLVK